MTQPERSAAYGTVACTPWHDAEPLDAGTGHQTSGLDAYKKTLGAIARDEHQRTAFRARISTHDAHAFVLVDELGRNFTRTPRDARAPRDHVGRAQAVAHGVAHGQRNHVVREAIVGERARGADGIVIPWYVDGAVWKLTIRRPSGTPRYVTVTGSANVLYNVDALQPGRVAVLVEGPFDVLAVEQAAGDLVASVASGTTGARRMR